MPAVFDTHKQHKVLMEAGFSDPQAQAITGVATAVIEAVATKSDLERLGANFERLEAKVDARFEGVEGRLDELSKRIGDLRAWGVAVFGATLGLYALIFTVLAQHLR